MEPSEWAMLIFIWLLTVSLAYGIGSATAYESIKDEAIKKGHAEYYLDSENNKQWRWK